MKYKRTIYELYKADVLLYRGTVPEIALERGVKESTIWFYQSPLYARRGTGKNRMKLTRAGKVSEDKRNNWNDILRLIGA